MASSIDINKIVRILNQNQGEDFTVKGVNRLRKYILDQSTELSNQTNATLNPLLNKTNTGVCPSEKTIIDSINILNNFIQNINNKTLLVNKLSQPINNNIDLISSVKNIVNTLDITIPIATTIIQAIPPPGLPGAVVGAVDTLDFLRNKVLYDKNGVAVIPQLTTPLTGALISVAVFNTFVADTVNNINKILDFLKECITQNNLNINIDISSFSPITLNIVETQNNIETNIETNISQYQGFVIEIEEKDFTPTVKQKRAIGKNAQGIVLISTPYSFTTNDQTLINELKLIIDRDNLKAY